MEISGTSAGAATYALKKALEIPDSVLDLLPQQPVSAGLLSIPADIPVQAPDDSDITGKGGIINIIA